MRGIGAPAIRNRIISLFLPSLGLAFCLACGFAPARAQDPPSSARSSDQTPILTAPAGAPQSPGEKTATQAACPQRLPLGIVGDAAVQVVLDPDTLWRPKAGEVRFSVKMSDGTIPRIHQIQVCMGWSGPPPNTLPLYALMPSPEVRSIAADGQNAAMFGAVVPSLQSITLPLFSANSIASTAVYTVPIADMVVQVRIEGRERDDVIMLPIGVTFQSTAFIVVMLCFVAFFLMDLIFINNMKSPIQEKVSFYRVDILLLKLISTQDGFASLSQLQVILWTLTVGASAVYVMVLSGSLINLTDGTLVLLGIAGSAALLARIPKQVPGTDPAPAGDTPQIVAGVVAADVPQAPAVVLPPAVANPNPAVGPHTPRWSDLVVVDNTLDVTRVQMLIFTFISAAFVVLKVIVGYAIPEIPQNFQILMGLSNGIYVVGRQLPKQVK